MTTKVTVDADLEEIIPPYLEKTKSSIARMAEWLGEDEYEKVKGSAHRLKGSGGGYGFDLASEIAHSLEVAAGNRDRAECQVCISKLGDYFSDIEIEYVEEE